MKKSTVMLWAIFGALLMGAQTRSLRMWKPPHGMRLVLTC